jgi:hypothetical protein
MRSARECATHDAATTHFPARERDRSDRSRRAQIAGVTSLHAARDVAARPKENLSFLVAAMHMPCRFLVSALSPSCRPAVQLLSFCCSRHRMSTRHRKNKKTTWRIDHPRAHAAPAAITTEQAFPEAAAREDFGRSRTESVTVIPPIRLRCCAAPFFTLTLRLEAGIAGPPEDESNLVRLLSGVLGPG